MTGGKKCGGKSYDKNKASNRIGWEDGRLDNESVVP